MTPSPSLSSTTHLVASGNTPEGLQLIALWIVVPYSVAYYSDRTRALIGLGILLAAFAVYAAEDTDITSGQAGTSGRVRSSWYSRLDRGSPGSCCARGVRPRH
jgi:hypothetical protein